MATPITSTAGTAIFARVLAEFTRELSQDEIDDFRFVSSMDLKKAINQLQDQQKSQKRMQNLRRLSAFVEAMDQFDKVVHVFLNVTNLLGFIWGPAKFMLLIAGSYSEALNDLLDAYQEIGEHMPLLEQYEPYIKSNPYLQEIVSLIYSDILTFHRKAMKHFRQRAWKQLFRATWRTFRTDFGTIISNLQSHRRLLDSQAIFLGVQQIMKVMQELHEARRASDVECESRKAEDELRRQHAVVTWLSAADSANDHEDALSVHENESESGAWLFQQDVIKDWIDECSVSEPRLWINGKPGAGKTILASKLIEECRRNPHATIAYFYCKHEDPSRDSFIAFARSIISQLTRLNPSLLPFVLQVRTTSGTTSLQSSKLAKEILNTSVESFDNLILVIDGLDECIKAQKDEIVSWIKFAVASAETDDSRILRCCFLSQEDNDTGKLLKGFPTFRITEQHNNQDILHFCERGAAEIGQNFGLVPQEVQSLRDCVAKNADGMFLYAKLVIDNLGSQVSKAALHQEIESIPPDLNQLYHRIRHRILDEASPAEKAVAKRLLSWLLCAKRPLRWHEIQGATCLDLENDTFNPSQRLIKGIKELCGSMVEVRKGGAICFVHLTAKYFLQHERSIPMQLEHVHLTRLCFCQLSLASHACSISRESIRQYILRGEYAFTEYSVIYAFDHLLDVLSEEKEGDVYKYEHLCKNMRKFVTKRVNAPTDQPPSDKHIDRKLRRIKGEDFYSSLKHAITFHKTVLEKREDGDQEEAVLNLLHQLTLVRSVLEAMSAPSLSAKLDALYGQNLFKCSEPRCESFHNGFITKTLRDKHCDEHKRMFLCNFPGCSSAMIGFSTLKSLKRHEQDYHKGIDAEASFPWHGNVKTLNIAHEIKNNNYDAFKAWISQKDGLLDDIDVIPDEGALRTASTHGRIQILEDLLRKIDPSSRYNRVKYAMRGCISQRKEDSFLLMLKHFTNINEPGIYQLLNRALRSRNDRIAKELLKYHTSPFHFPANWKRKASYLNLAVRYGRSGIIEHLFETYQVKPEIMDNKNQNSLIVAAEFGQTEIAKYLIQTQGCNKWTANQEGVSPLSTAGRQGQEEFIQSIYPETEDTIEGSIAQVDEWLRTAQLRNACRDGNDAKVIKLLDEGSLHVDELDKQLRTPWLWALDGQHEGIIRAFLKRPDVNFLRQFRRSYDKYSNRPGALHIVALAGNTSIMRLLLESRKFHGQLDRKCSNLGKSGKDDLGGTPLRIAAKCGHTDVVKLLKIHILEETLDESSNFHDPEITQATITSPHSSRSALDDEQKPEAGTKSYQSLEADYHDPWPPDNQDQESGSITPPSPPFLTSQNISQDEFETFTTNMAPQTVSEFSFPYVGNGEPSEDYILSGKMLQIYQDYLDNVGGGADFGYEVPHKDMPQLAHSFSGKEWSGLNQSPPDASIDRQSAASLEMLGDPYYNPWSDQIGPGMAN